jgi:hypothetical protein
MSNSDDMPVRTRFLAVELAEPGMVLAKAVTNQHMHTLLPAATLLSEENIRQLRAHGAEFLTVSSPDHRTPEEVAAQARDAAHNVRAVFRNADLTEPAMAALFNCVLAYRSA